ncbi:hypothetical protein [Bdellovibrio sp. HCB-110]|uniref:hypothetical protein n=1 Tax=Bdellovibrio sp. HCB-110 TaxID=3391182 RepID=UPI0039B43197
MKNAVFWSLFFLICMGVGFLHGVLPQGLSRSYFISPTKVQVLTTDEIFFHPELRERLEDELNVKFSVTITRDWDAILANTVSSPAVDLIFLPSFWASTLAHQNLLADIAGPRKELLQRVASDFTGKYQEGFYFLPFYWMKTGIKTPGGESFPEFLKNKKESVLFLLADEDLLLKHFQVWKEQGLWDLVAQKKILTLQLDQLLRELPKEGAMEASLTKEFKGSSHPQLSALLMWGAVIPANSSQKNLVLEILGTLTTPEYQESTLLKTPFNSTFSTVTGNEIPLQRRADFIRDLQLKDTLILEGKDQDAKIKLKNDFNFIL